MKKKKYTVSRVPQQGGNAFYIWDEHGNYFEEDPTTEQVQDRLNKNLLTKTEKKVLGEMLQHHSDDLVNSGCISFNQLERLEQKLK